LKHQGGETETGQSDHRGVAEFLLCHTILTCRMKNMNFPAGPQGAAS
jgi:hypothetical protein